MNDVELLATTLFSETKDPKDAEGIASVILNRTAKPKRFGGSIQEVVFAPSQFSGVGSKEWNKVINKNLSEDEERIYKDFLRISYLAVNGKLKDPTGGADHYANLKISKPSWAKVYKRMGDIGSHSYFKEVPIKKPKAKGK